MHAVELHAQVNILRSPQIPDYSADTCRTVRHLRLDLQRIEPIALSYITQGRAGVEGFDGCQSVIVEAGELDECIGGHVLDLDAEIHLSKIAQITHVSRYTRLDAGRQKALLAADATSPSTAAARGEMRRVLEEALDSLDREVLSLRHFEHLSNAETAQVLNIKRAAASKRYVRALKRLRGVLTFEGDDRSRG